MRIRVGGKNPPTPVACMQIEAVASVNVEKVQPVYVDGDGSVSLAQANAAATSRVLGICMAAVPATSVVGVAIAGVMGATTAEWDAVTGQTGGLTPGKLYFLSDVNAGQLLMEDNLASLGTGDFRVQVGCAISSTKLDVATRDPEGPLV